MAGAAAAACLALAGFAAPAQAAYFQNYDVTTPYHISSIVLFDKKAFGGGLTNSFLVEPPGSLIVNPFPQEEPILYTGFFGVSALGSEEGGQHLVLALDDAFAAGIIGDALTFADIFPDFSETALIDALILLDTPDLPTDDAGYAAQMAAKDAAYGLLGGFSDQIVFLGGAFGSVDTFSLVSFSTAAAAGSGFSYTTAVPEPLAWSLMITGFGMAGALLRRRTAFA